MTGRCRLFARCKNDEKTRSERGKPVEEELNAGPGNRVNQSVLEGARQSGQWAVGWVTE